MVFGRLLTAVLVVKIIRTPTPLPAHTNEHTLALALDPPVYRLAEENFPHHLGVVVDGGPKMISFSVDGKLCDGGPTPGWPNGHLLFDPRLGDVGSGVGEVTVATEVVRGGRVYARSLYTGELIGNWRAGAAQ